MSKIDFQNVHTMIGADATVTGNVELEGGLIVYGKIYGHITTKGPVRIAKGAIVQGNVTASDVHIGGTVKGNVTAGNRVVLGHESALAGDLVYRRLAIEEGAQFEGRCDVRSLNESAVQANNVGKK